MRRLLYVAASRAREELHLFARPTYKTEKDGSPTLVEPRESLLATAWPALEPEVREKFAAWRAPREAEVAAIAAVAEDTQKAPLLPRGTRLRRLQREALDELKPGPSTAAEPAVAGLGQLYERHEGGLRARALGIAVHSLLEEAARLRATTDWNSVRTALTGFESRVAAQIRAMGLDRIESGRASKRALEIVLKATHDAIGAWILSPHPEAESETRWAGVLAGGRPSRISRSPGSEVSRA